MYCRSQWPRGLTIRRRSAAARLLRSWVRIPPGAWIFVCCECYVLSGRGLCDELITRTGVPYRLWCVVVCDLETSRMRRPWPALGRRATEKRNSYVLSSGKSLWAMSWKNVEEKVRNLKEMYSQSLRTASLRLHLQWNRESPTTRASSYLTAVFDS